MTDMEKLYQRARDIASKTNINVVVGSGTERPVDIELYSPKLKPNDYPTLLMHQLKGRKPSNKSKVYYLLGGGSLK